MDFRLTGGVCLSLEVLRASSQNLSVRRHPFQFGLAKLYVYQRMNAVACGKIEDVLVYRVRGVRAVVLLVPWDHGDGHA